MLAVYTQFYESGFEEHFCVRRVFNHGFVPQSQAQL